jgi:hypothetical protein
MPNFGAQINTSRIPILGLIPEQAATASPPASPVEGLFWNDTTAHVIKVYLAGAWTTLGNAGAGGPPSGAAGGDLGSSYPNPTVVKAQSGFTINGVAAVITTDSRLSDSRTPSGTAGGKLVGTYPNPSLVTGAITPNELASQAVGPSAIGLGLISTADSGNAANTTAALRSIGTSSGQAMNGSTRLDQIIPPTAPLSMNGSRITTMADPQAAMDAANKNYVDTVAQGLDLHGSVKLATTTSLSSGGVPTGAQTVDGIAVVTNDRVLVKNQSNAVNNGIWIANTAGAWNRATDADNTNDLSPGSFVFVEQGTVQADTGWVMTNDTPPAPGTDAINWTQFSGAGSIIAGTGLAQTGTTINAQGTPSRISVSADNIDIDAAYAGQASITTLGAVATGAWNATTIAIAKGGTGGTDVKTARNNLGVPSNFQGVVPALTAGAWTTIQTYKGGPYPTDITLWVAATLEQIYLDVRCVTPGTGGAAYTDVQVRPGINYAASALSYSVSGQDWN